MKFLYNYPFLPLKKKLNVRTLAMLVLSILAVGFITMPIAKESSNLTMSPNSGLAGTQ